MTPQRNSRRDDGRNFRAHARPWESEPWVFELRRLVSEMNANVDGVIVEGPSDRRAIKRAGFERDVFMVGESNGIIPFVESIDALRIAILTDYDREGRTLNAKLRDHLSDRRVKPIWRRELGKVLTMHGRYDIESMNSVFEDFPGSSTDFGRYR